MDETGARRPTARRVSAMNLDEHSREAPDCQHKPTFCRICEPLCGMIATVEDGRLTALRPDKDHPLSAGFACQKGVAFSEIVNDPDRVLTPLRRSADGGFEPGQLGRGDVRHRRPVGRYPSKARLRGHRLVLREPRRVQLQPHAEPDHLHARLRARRRLPPPGFARVHRGQPGRQQPIRRQPTAGRVRRWRCRYPTSFAPICSS